MQAQLQSTEPLVTPLSDSQFYGIHKRDLDFFWPTLSAYISAACERNNGRYDTEHVYKGILSDDYQVWASLTDKTIEAVCVTEVVDYATKRVCRIMIATGKSRDHWIDFLSYIEDWARKNNCEAMESIARKGWARELKQFGYDDTHAFIEKEL